MSGFSWAVRIQGANGCRAYARSRCGLLLWADTSGRTEPVVLRVRDEDRSDEDDEGAPALFCSREAAEQAGLAARWNNQTYEVVVARGRVRAEGRGVNTPNDGWFSCQSEYAS